MTFPLLTNQFLYTIRELTEVIYNTKIPDYGYLFTSTTMLLFLFEFFNVYKIKKLERQVKSLKEHLNEHKQSKIKRAEI
jgi:hypothetical protein